MQLLVLISLSLLAEVFSEELSQQLRPNLRLLDCFEYKKNYWLVGQAFHTRSVQFKDECLRVCLSSTLRGSPCLSAMHIPGDDQCVISDQDQLTRPDLFVENDADHSFTVSYFRNTCIDPPTTNGGRLESRLMGYRGGQGVLEMHQVKGRNPHIMVIMTGLKEHQKYDILYSPTARVTSCLREVSPGGHSLVTIESDQTGMAIQPWREVDFHILDDDVLNKMILVVEHNTSTVVDCGKLQVKGNVSDWETAKNGGENPVKHFIFVIQFVIMIIVSSIINA